MKAPECPAHLTARRHICKAPDRGLHWESVGFVMQRKHLAVAACLLAIGAGSAVAVAAQEVDRLPPPERVAAESLGSDVDAGAVEEQVVDFLKNAPEHTFDPSSFSEVITKMPETERSSFLDGLIAAQSEVVKAEAGLAELWAPYEDKYQSSDQTGQAELIEQFVLGNADVLSGVIEEVASAKDKVIAQLVDAGIAVNPDTSAMNRDGKEIAP